MNATFYFLLFSFLLISNSIFAQTNWQPLITDSQLSDFQQLNGTATYQFDNEVLTGISKLNTPNSFLTTKKKYKDFILEFEVWIENGLNSGVQIRSASKDNLPDGRVFGYQVEIETSDRKWAGGIYDEARRGWLYPLTRNKNSQNAFKNGKWNHFRIEAIGKIIRTWVNGIPCSNLVDNWTSEGFIAFQVHSISKKEEEGKVVKWKNIQILTDQLEKERLPYPTTAPEISYLHNELTPNEIRKGWRLLWDGKSSTGWRSVSNDQFPKKGWMMTDGLLNVLDAEGKESENGGDIMTVDTYSNFELSVDFIITKGANSGIKYFVDPSLNQGKGSAIGLEFQILDDAHHPDAKNGINGNRTMGALYDLIPPRNLSETNREEKRTAWGGQFNRAKIIVRDGHVEHWLNEIKIVEYQRLSQVFQALIGHSKYKNWDNFGQQKEGHILLQDHGDFVSFKNIKIREF